MQLRTALRIEPGQAVAFTGAGGKSAAIRRLAREFPWAIITTTTKFAAEQRDLAEHHLIDPAPQDLGQIAELVYPKGTVLVTGPFLEAEAKWAAPTADVLEELALLANKIGAPLLIEADGARGRSLKAPAEHEPAVPGFVDLIVPVAALDVLGQPIESEAVHRPERVAALLGLPASHPIGPAELALLIASPEGGVKGLRAVRDRHKEVVRQFPSSDPKLRALRLGKAEIRVLLNKVIPRHLAAGREIAGLLLDAARAAGNAPLPRPGSDLTNWPPEPSYAIRAIALANLQAPDPVLEVHGPVGGIVLAAGGSSRLGQPKQLIKFRGRPLVWHVVRAGLAAGLAPIVVVAGAETAAIRRALQDERVTVVENLAWKGGQSTSLRQGLSMIMIRPWPGMPLEAAVFLLADMPLVDPELIRRLVGMHRETLSPLVAPRAAGRRANPVLFDKVTFPDLRRLSGDQGGRSLFDRYASAWVDWTESAMLDLDTPDDLERLQKLE